MKAQRQQEDKIRRGETEEEAKSMTVEKQQKDKITKIPRGQKKTIEHQAKVASP